MKEKLKKLLAGLLGSGIMILLLFGTFAVVALVGGNVMRLFGFRYDSVGQLLLYFLLGELIGLPLDLISTALPKALYRMGKVDRRQGNLLYNGYLVYHRRVLGCGRVNGQCVHHRTLFVHSGLWNGTDHPAHKEG